MVSPVRYDLPGGHDYNTIGITDTGLLVWQVVGSDVQIGVWHVNELADTISEAPGFSSPLTVNWGAGYTPQPVASPTQGTFPHVVWQDESGAHFLLVCSLLDNGSGHNIGLIAGTLLADGSLTLGTPTVLIGFHVTYGPLRPRPCLVDGSILIVYPYHVDTSDGYLGAAQVQVPSGADDILIISDFRWPNSHGIMNSASDIDVAPVGTEVMVAWLFQPVAGGSYEARMTMFNHAIIGNTAAYPGFATLATYASGVTARSMCCAGFEDGNDAVMLWIKDNGGTAAFQTSTAMIAAGGGPPVDNGGYNTDEGPDIVAARMRQPGGSEPNTAWTPTHLPIFELLVHMTGTKWTDMFVETFQIDPGSFDNPTASWAWQWWWWVEEWWNTHPDGAFDPGATAAYRMAYVGAGTTPGHTYLLVNNLYGDHGNLLDGVPSIWFWGEDVGGPPPAVGGDEWVFGALVLGEPLSSGPVWF
jgi:hypothetical protein